MFVITITFGSIQAPSSLGIILLCIPLLSLHTVLQLLGGFRDAIVSSLTVWLLVCFMLAFGLAVDIHALTQVYSFAGGKYWVPKFWSSQQCGSILCFEGTFRRKHILFPISWCVHTYQCMHNHDFSFLPLKLVYWHHVMSQCQGFCSMCFSDVVAFMKLEILLHEEIENQSI